MKSRKLTGLTNLRRTYSSLKISEKFLIHIIFLLLVITALSIFATWNKDNLISSPRSGGVINEGVIGIPRFINPLFAEKSVDRDLTSLVYSGLLRRTATGELIPDLAKSYEISEDGKTYTFTLKENITFHDGRDITADDVVFTIETIQNGNTKSIEQRNWIDVFVEKLNDETIQFILPDTYAPFIQNLTLGILPKHIWDKTSPEDMLFSSSNLEPIGSGPFMIKSIKKTPSNSISMYSFMYFENFSLGKPFLDKVNIYFYENIEEVENGYERKEIDSTIINVNSKKSETIIRSESISLFFNQNKAPILSEKYIRRAIDSAVNREAIVSDIFNGIAEPLNGPIPEQISPISDIDEAEYDPEESSNILEGEGWELNEEGLYEKDGKTISIKIATNNTETLLKTGEHITENLRNLGFDVSLEIYEENDLIQKIIRPRNFQILLFGTVINHGLDMYGFWHSSQRNDPGVNITQYTNIDVDSIVSKLRTEQDPEQRLDLYSRFEEEIKNDIPAAFLYARGFKYTSPPNLITQISESAVYSSERYSMIHTWHIEEDRVWPIFKNNNN